MLLEKMTTLEVSEYLEVKKSIIIPFGSLEQHGPHLPCGTDTFIAKQIADEAGEKAGVMVSPVIPIGFSPGLHPQFSGTITFSARTYISIILEVLSCLHQMGFRDFLLLTGHGMNFSPLKTALLDFFNDKNGRANVVGYWELDEVKEAKSFFNDENGVHCTIMETSMMLYLFPEHVDMSKSFDEFRRAKYILGKDEIKEVSNSGIIALTTNSSNEKGEAYYKASVKGITRLATMFEDNSLFK